MIEIVFSDSAYGSLQVGQRYGKGKYRGGATSVFFQKVDGTEPTPEEIEVAQKQAEEKARQDWESAIPLGSNREDLYCFPIALSVGAISEKGIGSQRAETLDLLFSIYPDAIKAAMKADAEINLILQKANENLSAVMKRYADGEAVRIWYSDDPDELCGMYWLAAQLSSLKSSVPVYLVKLPHWEYQSENTVVCKNGWGDVAPGEWGKYVALQEEAYPVLLSTFATKWLQLQQENAPLRVTLNGKLQSVSEDIYDSFILREIAAQPDEFKMAVVIGDVLGKYQLGIGDAWISIRIEKMIEKGLLEITKAAPDGDIKYRCTLRKCKG